MKKRKPEIWTVRSSPQDFTTNYTDGTDYTESMQKTPSDFFLKMVRSIREIHEIRVIRGSFFLGTRHSPVKWETGQLAGSPFPVFGLRFSIPLRRCCPL